MTEEMAMNLGSEALYTLVLLAGPLLAAAMATGLVVSVFQAVTQINESTLTFIPKILAVLFVLVFFGSWMLGVLQNYTITVLTHAGEWSRGIH